MRGIRTLAALALLAAGGCASAGPPAARFQVVYEQQYQRCRFQVLRDSRSSACFFFVRCGREWHLIPIESAACVP